MAEYIIYDIQQLIIFLYIMEPKWYACQKGGEEGKVRAEYKIYYIQQLYISLYITFDHVWVGSKVVCLSDGRKRRAKWCPKIPILQFFLALFKKGWVKPILTEGGGGGLSGGRKEDIEVDFLPLAIFVTWNQKIQLCFVGLQAFACLRTSKQSK